MIPPEWLHAARQRLAPLVQCTPLEYDPRLDVYLKWENLQVTGSFKVRGALNKVLTLQPWELEGGLVTASAGNHGQGVAFAARREGLKVVVFASEHAVPAKVSAMRAMGAEVRLVTGGYAEAEASGLAHARHSGAAWISPYNDGQVIAGQATLGMEIINQLEGKGVETVICPAGGGGLAAGMGQALRLAAHSAGLTAVQSEASAFLHGFYTRGSQAEVVETPSLADGLAGALEEGSITIPMTRELVKDFILISEEEIEKAVVFAWRRYGQVIEGSAAAALAAALYRPQIRKPMLVVISGGNIQPEVHTALLDKYPQAGDKVLP